MIVCQDVDNFVVNATNTAVILVTAVNARTAANDYVAVRHLWVFVSRNISTIGRKSEMERLYVIMMICPV